MTHWTQRARYILFEELFVVDGTEAVFVAEVETVDDRRVAVADNVLLFDGRVVWGNGTESFDDCCWELLLFDRLTVYWFGWGGLVGVGRFVGF
jgi:hypothetical protein